MQKLGITVFGQYSATLRLSRDPEIMLEILKKAQKLIKEGYKLQGNPLEKIERKFFCLRN